MGFGLLFVPLVGGYLFLTWCHWSQFRVRRQSGHHLLFRSAAVGLLLLVAAWVLELAASSWIRLPSGLVETFRSAVPFPYVSTAAVAFLLGPAAALAINMRYSKRRGAMRAVRAASDYMEILFVERMAEDAPVELTLRSGKAYVGWILNASVAEPQRKFVELLPLASGFRTDETHELRFTTNYAAVLPPLRDETGFAEASAFRVVLPVSEIRSARPFDFATYFRFQKTGTIG